MKYEYSLIHISEHPESSEDFYSISLIDAHGLTFLLNGLNVFLSGKYLFCFSDKDAVKDIKGEYSIKSLRFLPYFYNINLNTAIIEAPVYNEMCEKYGYPDFNLFRNHGEGYQGIIKLSDSEYDSILTLLDLAERHIDNHEMDALWSCRTRSDLISILRIAEAAQAGKHADAINDILRYIRANLNKDLSLSALCERFRMNRTTLAETIKKLTGLTPGQYVLTERLGQSRPELLFTELSVEDISAAYGFSDVNYYIRAFKKKYGVTPLQYRKSGVEKRIREQKNYHLKNGVKGLMAEEEFASYLRAGLGLAVIRLRREPDKSRFLASFREYIVGGRKDFYYTHCYDYEDELLSCFDDSERIKEELLSILFSLDVDRTPYHVILMKRWCSSEQQETLKETLETTYENCFRMLFEAADSLGDKSLYRLFDTAGITEEKLAAGRKPEIDALNETYAAYRNAFDALKTFDDSTESIMRLIDREAELRKATGYVPSSPPFDVLFGLFHDKNPEIRVYMEEKFPHDYFQKYDIHWVKRMSTSEIQKLDADYFLDEKNCDCGDASLAFTSEYLPRSVFRKVNSALMDCEDREKRLHLMKLFNNGPVVSIYPTTKFLPELQAVIEADSDSYDTRCLAWFVLNCTNKHIRAYAEELIRKGIQLHPAIWSVFFINYNQRDSELFAEKLMTSEKAEGLAYRSAFRNAIENKVSGLPLDTVPFVFRTCSRTSERLLLVRSLYKGGVYDQNVIEEGLLDADPEIRKTAGLMKERIPYIDIRYLNAANAGDYVRFFEEKERTGNEVGIGLAYYMTANELSESTLDPLKNDVFYDHRLLCTAARVRLLTEQKIEGFLAYIDGKPVGFIGCAQRSLYAETPWHSDEEKSDDIVVTMPVTFGDLRVAEALLRRAAKFAEEDGRKAWVALAYHGEPEEEWDALLTLCRNIGFHFPNFRTKRGQNDERRI